jgi:hypothetical protein
MEDDMKMNFRKVAFEEIILFMIDSDFGISDCSDESVRYVRGYFLISCLFLLMRYD